MWARRFDDALVEIQRARELDPVSPVLDTDACEIRYNIRQFQSAIDQCRNAIGRNPEFSKAHRVLGEVYLASGRFAEAIAGFQKALSLGGGASVVGKLGQAYAVSGNRAAATKILRDLEKSGLTENFYDMALIHAGLGDRDSAFQWLERCYEEGSRSLIFLQVAPVLDSLRGDPRFSDLVRRRFKSTAQ